jgi:hypothetical protein
LTSSITASLKATESTIFDPSTAMAHRSPPAATSPPRQDRHSDHRHRPRPRFERPSDRRRGARCLAGGFEWSLRFAYGGRCLHMRGQFRSDEEGRFLIQTVCPVHYAIPTDGPVDVCCVRRIGIRGSRRTSTLWSRPRATSGSTHIFDGTDPYLIPTRCLRSRTP